MRERWRTEPGKETERARPRAREGERERGGGVEWRNAAERLPIFHSDDRRATSAFCGCISLALGQTHLSAALWRTRRSRCRSRRRSLQLLLNPNRYDGVAGFSPECSCACALLDDRLARTAPDRRAFGDFDDTRGRHFLSVSFYSSFSFICHNYLSFFPCCSAARA